MRVERISIRNFLGIEHLEVTPGKLTEITGGNGAGKSSVLKALGNLIEGGHDPKLIRNGQEKAEILVELEGGLSFEKTITPKGGYLRAKEGGKKAKGTPKAALERLLDATSANPVDFMLTETKGRLKLLLEALPIEVSKADLADIAPDWPEIRGEALEALETIEKEIRQERRDKNAVAKNDRATVAELSAGLPEGDEDVAAELASAKDVLTAAVADHEAEQAKSQEAREEKLKVAQAKRDVVIEAAHAEYEATLQAETESQRAHYLALREQYEPKIAEAREKVAALEERQRHADQIAGTRATVERLRGQAEEAEKASAELTAKLERLQALKLEKLGAIREHLPGLEIREGEIYVDDIPFLTLNTATQIRVAVAVAKLRAGELGLICMDGMEALDEETFDQFRSMAEAQEELQFIVTRVTDGPLAVETAA